MNVQRTAHTVVGLLVMEAVALATRLVPAEAMESTFAFAVAYSLCAAVVPLLGMLAERVPDLIED